MQTLVVKGPFWKKKKEIELEPNEVIAKACRGAIIFPRPSPSPKPQSKKGKRILDSGLSLKSHGSLGKYYSSSSVSVV